VTATGGGVRPPRASPAAGPIAGVVCTLTLPWLLLCSPTAARAAQRDLRGSIGTQANPLSLQFRGSLGWSWRLFDSASPLLRDAAVSAGLSEALTPAYSRTEAWLQIAPVAVFDVRAGAELVGYFGSFGHLVGLPSYDSDFSDDAREALRDDARGAVGGVLSVTPTLKLALGRLAFRSSASFEWWLVDAPPVYYYEPYRGTLLDPGGDSLLALTSLALFDVSGDGSRRRQIGLYHDLLYVWSAPQNRRQRLGPFASWSLGDRRLGLAEPVLLVGILPYLEAPNRDGVSAIVAVSFRLDRKR
jgi:hypothetical protein